MRYLWVGLGGAAGSIARYAIGLNVEQSRFPWATLGVNLSGAFILGVFLTVALGHLSVAVITPITVGVLGGYTTVSSFSLQTLNLALAGEASRAVLNIVLSAVLCVAAVGCGFWLVAGWAG